VGERTSHRPGTFSWVDLATSDAPAAKDFYAGLFGWEFDDQPVPGDGTYSLARLGGRTAAAIFERTDMPPVWVSYVTVEDADAVAARGQELACAVLQQPFDVMEVGRMAVLSDPQGAVFAIWQPRASIGAEVVNEPGALCLNQLNTSDPERATEFYSELFGWRIEQTAPELAYWGIYNGETLNAGMMNLPSGFEGPPHWLAYFAVEDTDAAVARIGELGGQVAVPPMEVPNGGRIAVGQDPQGAAFALYAGYLDS